MCTKMGTRNVSTVSVTIYKNFSFFFFTDTKPSVLVLEFGKVIVLHQAKSDLLPSTVTSHLYSLGLVSTLQTRA